MSTDAQGGRTFDQVFVHAAKCDLQIIALAAMHCYMNQRHDYSVDANGAAVLIGDYNDRSQDFLPPSLSDMRGSPHGFGYRKDGVFVGLSIWQILSLCFTEEALELLLKHGYNKWLFWHHLMNVIVRAGWSVYDNPLPYSLEQVKKRVFEINEPFCFTSDLEGMRAAMRATTAEAAPCDYDLEKLAPASMVAVLLLNGFLLMKKQSRKLVVNPMWAHLCTLTRE